MQILQFSTAVPEEKYSTKELMGLFPGEISEDIKKNILNLGVENRHLMDYDWTSKSETIFTEESIIDLCLEACRKAIENASLSLKDIGYFIVTYDANPFLCPGLSQLLIPKLGFNPHIRHVNVQGMACSAFTKALDLARNHLTVHPDDFVLLCISGVNSYWFINQIRGLNNIMKIDRINSIRRDESRRRELRKWIAAMEFFLFGDGVAGIIMAKEGRGLSIKKIVEVTNLEENDYLAGYARLALLNEPFKFGFYSHLDKKIPELGIKYISMVLKRLFGECVEHPMKAMKKLAIHTGSQKILSRIADHNRIPPEKLVESFQILRDFGNLAGASLPFILQRIVTTGSPSKGDTVLTLGYGWGFSASASSLIVNQT
ncbi:MAG: hypothetical protein JSV51_06495 [Candidatus Bathyarchaeota archaeon]|nr:MAG: hypothetical protein JSV51_06495 [Candidatus Bathyarchaeota archaeon]